MQGIIPGQIYVPAPGEGQVPSGTDRYGASFWYSGTGDHISGPDPGKHHSHDRQLDKMSWKEGLWLIFKWAMRLQSLRV